MIQCKKCGSQDVHEEKGWSKAKGKSFSGPKCQSCGTWNFQPRNSGPVSAAVAVAEAQKIFQPKPDNSFLKSIDISLKSILEILMKQTKQMPIQPGELEPDEEVPF